MSASTEKETTAAKELIGRQIDETEKPPATVGADKGYHNQEFVGFCREQEIKPHVATITNRKVPGLDGRTTRSLGYQTSQRIRKRVEEIFGWTKEIGGLRKTKHRGTERVGLHTVLVVAAYNLVRMGKLMGSPP